MTDLRGLLARLADADFPFVVVGGYAAVAHGAPLVTQDLDVCCEFTEEALRRLDSAIGDLHPVHRMRPDRMPLTVAPGFERGLKNLYLDTDWGPLDLLGEVKGIGPYAAVLARSIEVEAAGRRIRLLSREATIAAKAAMGRLRDLEAIRHLREMAEDADEERGRRQAPPPGE